MAKKKPPARPKSPATYDTAALFPRAVDLARAFLLNRLFDAETDTDDDVRTHVDELYDARTHDRYIDWLEHHGTPNDVRDAHCAAEIFAVRAAYAFGVAVGSLVGPGLTHLPGRQAEGRAR